MIPNYIFFIIITISAFFLSSCRHSDSSTTTNNSSDITDSHFTSRNSDCGSYAGNYHSNVTDINNGKSYSGNTEITDNSTNCILSSNEIPNHNFNDANAGFVNSTSEQAGNYAIVKNTTMPLSSHSFSVPTALDLQTTDAVFLNGVTLDLLAAACYGVGNEPLGQEKVGCGNDQINNPWRYDPMSSLNQFGTDSHNAHTQPDGTYHYHGNPNAMFLQDCDLNAQISPLIGYAADGYPIYGPCYQDINTGNIVKATSSFRLKGNGGMRQLVAGYPLPVAGQGNVASNNYDGQFIGDWEYVENHGVLDECNGMTIDNQYGYYITDSYPWVLACFKGTVDSSFIKTGGQILKAQHRHP